MKEYNELVVQAKKGDVHAFSLLYEQFYEDLFRYAYYMLQNKTDAEDVVSESVLAAFESIHMLRDEKAFRSWMFQIVTNQCKRKRKEYTRKGVELDETLACNSKDWDAILDMRSAFQQLSEQERYIIGLSAIAGYHSKEIGKLLHMNPSTVRSKLHRGLEKMKQYLLQDSH